MALTASKILFYGPYTAVLKTVGATTLTLTSLKPESLVLNIEQKKGNAVFEDGSEEDWGEGLKMTGELTYAELSTTDIASIEGCDNLVVTFASGKVITIPVTCRFFVDVENGKTKITFFRTNAIGVAWSTMFVIS
jgi:hypothetical protein